MKKVHGTVEMHRYYNDPTFVCFLDPEYPFEEDLESAPIVVGIAYCGEVICGCCGGVYDLEELNEYSAPAVGFFELDWIPFNLISECMEDIRELINNQQKHWHDYCAQKEEKDGKYWYEG